jgi:large subunit ribosomal protein L21
MATERRKLLLTFGGPFLYSHRFNPISGHFVMFAVVRTGGKQYRVAEGDLIRVERLPGDKGGSIVLDEVLMAGAKIGAPLVSGASVAAEIVAQARGPKIIVFKKKRRQNYRRKNGHRQDLTILRITGISGV